MHRSTKFSRYRWGHDTTGYFVVPWYYKYRGIFTVQSSKFLCYFSLFVRFLIAYGRILNVDSNVIEWTSGLVALKCLLRSILTPLLAIFEHGAQWRVSLSYHATSFSPLRFQRLPQMRCTGQGNPWRHITSTTRPACLSWGHHHRRKVLAAQAVMSSVNCVDTAQDGCLGITALSAQIGHIVP